jgi:hypothetical protein
VKVVGSEIILVKPLAEDEHRVAIVKTLLYRACWFLQFLWPAEVLDFVRGGWRIGGFPLQEARFPLFVACGVVDIELIRERACRQLRSRRQRSP